MARKFFEIMPMTTGQPASHRRGFSLRRKCQDLKIELNVVVGPLFIWVGFGAVV